jgi:hydroxyethylthiazole kinase
MSVRRPDPDAVVSVLERVRGRTPLVHCMTNVVVANFTANVLLAVGASPAMVENVDESAELARVADGLLVNLGTLSPGRAEAMRSATEAARRAGTPWVLDPVAVGALTFRTGLAGDLLHGRPAVVRGNASEVLALAGNGGSARGVDSTVSTSEAGEPARRLAGRSGAVVAVSGEVDLLTDGTDVVTVHTGDPLLTKVTGAGCALGALVAACCAVEESPLLSATAATVVLTVAAEQAAGASAGPGTFAIALVDALHRLDADTVGTALERA